LVGGKCIDNLSLDKELPNNIEIFGWDLKLYWEFKDINKVKYIDLALYSRKFSWFAFGIGNSMLDADMWIFQKNNRTNIESWSV